MTAFLLLVLKLSVVALTFAIGLRSSPSDLAYLWRRPVELLRAVLAMYVAVPLAILALIRLLPMPIAVEAAMLILAISAGAPLLPRKLMTLGREGYVLSLVVTSTLLAIVTVPCWLAVLDPLVDRGAAVAPGAIALLLAKAFLAPLLGGMVVRLVMARWADRIADALLGIAGAALSIGALAFLALRIRVLASVGWIPFLSLVGMAVVATAIGHVCGGPDPADRSALAVSCATRHVGIAILVATTASLPETIPLVVTYVIASAVVSALYLKWRGHGKGRATPAAAAPSG